MGGCFEVKTQPELRKHQLEIAVGDLYRCLAAREQAAVRLERKPTFNRPGNCIGFQYLDYRVIGLTDVSLAPDCYLLHGIKWVQFAQKREDVALAAEREVKVGQVSLPGYMYI